MKKTKLSLGRETIRHLEATTLAHVAGGADSGAQTCTCSGTPTVHPCTTVGIDCSLVSCNCGSRCSSVMIE